MHLSILVSRLGLVVAALGGCSSDGACDPDAPGTICTVAGNGIQGFSGNGGQALEAQFWAPMDMAVAPDGELWVLDFNNYVVRAIDADGVIRTAIGNGDLGDSPPPGQTEIEADRALLNHVPDLYFHDGYLYLAAWHNSRVQRVDLDTMTLENHAGIGTRALYHGDDGPALEAALDGPSSVIFDPGGALVITDQFNQVIRRVDEDGMIHRIAGSCVADQTSRCGPYQEPATCPDSDRTVCGSPATECAMPCNPGFGGDGGSALEARLALPYGAVAPPGGRLAYDARGNLYIADTSNHRIRRIDANGIITTIAGTGTSGFTGDGGPAIDAELNQPVDLEIAADGTVYFTDVDNHCVRAIDRGIVTTVAGQCDPGRASSTDAASDFAGDGGPPADAVLNHPYGIELAGDKLYIADSFNHRIRVVNL